MKKIYVLLGTDIEGNYGVGFLGATKTLLEIY